MLKASIKRLILDDESKNLFVFEVVDCERLVVRLSKVDTLNNKTKFIYHVFDNEELKELKKLIKTIK